MIVGGYTLDLYCDVPGCKAGNLGGHREYFAGFSPGAAQFYGEERVIAEHHARAAGWKFSRREGTARCPSCKGKRRR